MQQQSSTSNNTVSKVTEERAAEKEQAAKSLQLGEEDTQYESDIKAIQATQVTTETQAIKQCLE